MPLLGNLLVAALLVLPLSHASAGHREIIDTVVIPS